MSPRSNSLAGPYDLLVSLEADGPEALEAARGAIAATPGVAEVMTLVVLRRHPVV